MRITVFGATGNVGRRVVTEALARGHEVTAVIRNPARAHEVPAEATVRVGNADQIDDVTELSAGQDLVISATRPVAGEDDALVATARSLLAGLARTNVRLLLVGGAGNLTVPSNGKLAVDDPNIVPPAWRGIAQACVQQFEAVRTETTVDWAYLSPPAMLEPGERTGHYRTGTDELLFDTDGTSRISMEDFAIALLDEAERPKHHRSRFTVGY
ncbi:NAD(P)-dependent oxidoreductase [Phytoactinopolyspora endophytica]|uniref:NAD(P)-dependent oxidoreductase n=1 Tax=Phytoactinopolyspora endophytica TaxID=1642495 RepID=UPI00101BC838|nr:NAD(P)H-binding protein [Phytoactinopolyspora endophytica]